MSRVNTNKELAALEDLARDQDWELSRTDGGHIEWRSPAGQIIISASTPSRSTIPNIKSDLKAAGLLLDKGEVVRMRRSKRAHDRECRIRMTAIHDALIDGGYPISKEFDQQDITEDIELTLFNRILPDGRGFDLKCSCGKISVHPTGFIAHIRKCLVAKQEAGTMDRDMHEAPPKEQRIECPDCGQFYWNTQPHLLANHMKGDHGKELCLFCGRYFMVRNLSRHAKKCEEELVALAEMPAIFEGIPLMSDPTPTEVQPVQLSATDYGAHIATPQEITVDADGWRPPVPDDEEPEPEMNGQHVARNRGLMDRIREVMTEVTFVGEPDCMKTLHGLVGMDCTMDVFQAAIKSLADKGEITREMATPRKTKSLRWTASLVPPGSSDVSNLSEQRFRGVAQAVQAAGIDFRTVTDDDLWSLLEMVLDGPIPFNRANYAVITEWMEVTRKLFQLKVQG